MACSLTLQKLRRYHPIVLGRSGPDGLIDRCFLSYSTGKVALAEHLAGIGHAGLKVKLSADHPQQVIIELLCHLSLLFS